MGRFIDFLAFALLVLVAVAGRIDWSQEPDPGVSPRRPELRLPPATLDPALEPPAFRGRGRRLPDPSPFDPTVTIEMEQKGNSTGTAFSLDARGTWMTARHVTDGCTRLAIVKDNRAVAYVSEVLTHPRADVSLMRTNGGSPALPFATGPLAIGQEGFHFGFPQGRPGAVYSTLLGRQKMRVVGGRGSRSEPVIAWAEQKRDTDPSKPLGGISGGPILDDRGAVVGVHVAGSLRRGRNFSVAPKSMNEMLRMAAIAPARDGGDRGEVDYLTPSAFPEAGRRLRNRLSVAKVVCFVDDGDGSRRRRR